LKKSNKEKNKQKRLLEKARKKEEEIKKEKQIIRTISEEEIKELKQFNKNTFLNGKVRKEDMLECLQKLLMIIVHSSYLDEITRMARNSISTDWFDRKVDNELVEEILTKELESAEKSSTESVALKLCYWANRIAHHLENEVVGKEKKYKANELYVKYYLNPNYQYDLLSTRQILKEGKSNETVLRLENILQKEATSLEEVRTPEQLNNLFLGLNIRNELWTLKQEMLKTILLEMEKNGNSPIKVTCLSEKKEVAIKGSETLRLIIREMNGIAPVVMHCDKEKINSFLEENNMQPIQEETSSEIIRFAQNGKVGIHFVLDEEQQEILEYEASNNVTAKRLNDIMYKGEDDGR